MKQIWAPWRKINDNILHPAENHATKEQIILRMVERVPQEKQQG